MDYITTQADGKLLISGSFSAVNGAVRGCVARLNSDGTLDQSFMNGMSGANSQVSAAVPLDDGSVLAGGWFTKMNGADAPNIALLNANGSLASGGPSAPPHDTSQLARYIYDLLKNGLFLLPAPTNFRVIQAN